jgi:hypothetical protein
MNDYEFEDACDPMMVAAAANGNKDDGEKWQQQGRWQADLFRLE